MKMRIPYALIMVLLFGMCSLVSASDDEMADEDAMPFQDKLQACFACHGENGDKPLAPDYPILAGQYQDYLAAALRQYRDGLRTNEIMALQVEILELTDSDIDELAAYFSNKPSNLRSLAD